MAGVSDRSLFRGRDAYEVLQVRPDADDVVIQAAFRALAALRHPDSDPSTSATARMAELNDAYAKVRTRDLRAVYDKVRAAGGPPRQTDSQPAGAAPRRPATGDPSAGVLDFGRFAGWTIADLARQHPEYLEWLSRHSSGIRYRSEIAKVLAQHRSNGTPSPSRR